MRNDSRNRDSPCRCLIRAVAGVEKTKTKCEQENSSNSTPLYICICIWIFFSYYTVYISYYNITVDDSVKFRDVYSFKPHTNGKHMKPKSAHLYCTCNALDYENEIRVLKKYTYLYYYISKKKFHYYFYLVCECCFYF